MDVSAKLVRPPATSLVNVIPLREGISKIAVQNGKDMGLVCSLGCSLVSKVRRLNGEALEYGSAIDFGTSSTGICSFEEGIGTSNFLKPS